MRYGRNFKQFRRVYKTPTDEKRDHRNFTEHLAGGNQLEFDTFDVEDGLGKYDSAVEASYRGLRIKRPKGRLPFNSNLLTAGQVKFSAHEISYPNVVFIFSLNLSFFSDLLLWYH